MRAHVAAHGPRVAVVEHRVDQIEADLTAMRAARERSQRWALWIAVLAALLGWPPSSPRPLGADHDLARSALTGNPPRTVQHRIPGPSKASDGEIGDTVHASRSQD